MIRLKNNAQSVLTLPLSATQTLLNLSLGDGGKFPVLSLGDHCWCALRDSAGNLEYVKVTERNGDILTVVRGQEGTPARYWATGTRVQLRLTAKTWEDMAGEHWRRVVNAVGDPLVPAVTGQKTFTLPGNLLTLFEQTRSFRLYTKEGTFLHGYVANALASGDVTSVTVDGPDLPAVLAAVDVGLPLNVHPKSVNAAPVSHLTAPDAHPNLLRPIQANIEDIKAVLGSLVRPDGTIDTSLLPVATRKTRGAIMVGKGISVTDQGELSVNEQEFETVPHATAADSAENATLAHSAEHLRNDQGRDMLFSWQEQEGQPSLVWGINAPDNDIKVWNPANFNVNYANSANYANTAGLAPANGGTAGACSGVIAFRGSSMIPAGGTWAYHYSYTSTDSGGSGTIAGGSFLSSGAPGIAIRIA